MASTKEKILDSAEKLFARHGIDGASLRAITSDAEVNLGSIYYYFRTKDQLVIEVFNRRIEQYSQKSSVEFAELMGREKKPTLRELWLVMARTMLSFRVQYPDFIRVMLHLQISREHMFRDNKPAQSNLFENDFIQAVTECFPAANRALVRVRSKVTLNLFHLMAMNYPLVIASLQSADIPADDDLICEQLADVATASLQEYLD